MLVVVMEDRKLIVTVGDLTHAFAAP